MLRNLYILTFIFVILNIIYIKTEQKYSKVPNRELIILLDDKSNNMEGVHKTLNNPPKYETPTDNPSGIGAMTITYLIAMHQQAAPILVDRSLIENILDHKEIFEDFATKDIQFLKNKYSKYSRFKQNNQLKILKNHCAYIYKKHDKLCACLQEILNKTSNPDKIKNELANLIKNKKFNVSEAPKSLNFIEGSKKNFVLFAELMVYFLCYKTLQDANQWIIKKVSQDLYLFIPKSYLGQININTDKLAKTCKKTDNVTEIENNLGLKVNHLKDIISFKEFKNKSELKKKKDITYYLEKIFVTQKNIWSIYIAGHGFPETPIKPLYQQLQKLEQLYDKSSKTKNYRDIQNLKKIKQEISYVKNKIASLEEHQNGIIVSLPIKQFQNLIIFFNEKVNTAILYYTSCYAGGEFLVEPYKKNSKDIILNYHVISGTVAENIAIQELPVYKIPPYSNKINKNVPITQDLTIKDIDIENKTLALHTTLQYKNFFDGLKNGLHLDNKNLPSVVHNLHPYTDEPCGTLRDECLGNIPSVRLAGSNQFTIIPHDNSFLAITDEFLKKQNAEIDLSSDKAALVYSSYIKPKVIFDKKKHKRIPATISMVPGFAVHTFEEVSAPQFGLSQILGSFLCFPELSASKIFFIKKLKCTKSKKLNKYLNSKNKTAELCDVVVMRNVLNSDGLDKKKPGKPPLDTCIYFTEPNSKESLKITWDGPFINEKNYKINKCTLNEHKREIVAYHPNLKDHLSDAVLA